VDGLRGHAKALFGALLVCSLVVLGSGSAEAAFHPFEGSFGPFVNPQSVAADTAGNIYVLDQGVGNVQKFDAEGIPAQFSSLASNVLTGATTPAGSFSFEASSVQLAVDRSSGPASGDLYVTDYGHGVVDVFDGASGAYLGQLSEANGAPLGTPCGVATDPSGRVYVAELFGKIDRYDPSANPPVNGDYDGQFTPAAAICQLAADAAGDVYGTAWFGGVLKKFDASLFGGSGEGTQVATNVNAAAVAPDGDVYAAHPASVEQFDASGASLGSFGDGEVDESRGIAVGPGGDVIVANSGTGSVSIFGPTPPPEPPTVEATSAVPAHVEAKLQATIDPGNVEATYHFEYGLTAAYGSSTVSVPIQPAGSGVDVALPIVGLTPGTTYHFRAVATNSVTTVEGPDQTFTTLPAGESGSCPNAALRQGPSALLPECRAYELVSPVDKNGGGVNQKTSVLSDSSGDSVSFISTAAFAGAESSSLQNTYIARRGAGDWATESVDPAQLNPHGLLVVPTPAMSPDLAKAFQASKRALAPGATENGSNVYLRDNLTGRRTLVATAEGNRLFEDMANAGAAPFIGAADDFSHVFFDTSVPLVSGAGPFNSNIYEYTDGELRLVNYLPGGSLSAGAHGGGGRIANENSVSADGLRIFFTAEESAFGPLYLREDGTRTVAISESQRTGEEGVVAAADFGAASPDGSVAYFVSSADLTEDSAGGGLYRYDVESEDLTNITPATGSPSGPKVGRVLAVSDDASYVYFSAQADLAEGAEETGFLSTNVYVWHDGEIKYVARTAENEQEFSGPGQRLSSPDGRYFAMGSYSPMTAEDVPSPQCPTDPAENNAPEACRDVYLYSYETGDLKCVSCAGPGAGNSMLGGQEFHESGSGDHLPQSVLDDGTVLYDTPNKLVPSDINGMRDVYAWKDGSPALVSPGTARYAANFGEATADGSSIFIRTSQPLVRQDIDQSVDLYDARVDGGLAAQNQSASGSSCEAEGCRGEAPPPPAGQPPASASLKHGGNSKGSCSHYAAKARRAGERARALQKRAGKAGGEQGRRLRQEAKHERKRAKQLRSKARNCGGNH
jgi:hypothetical protein